ncbi:putative alpha,alpha-trehalose-phosphate synthase [UDP-forming] 7 [Tetrabaena socialis]|uniref:Putative alpha,alpha-trehalose-phosphate synthase [UDP-forming] 7 n=1 Tax=Tetrabaena socialis TaxID=47790 RepID=A0A2J8A9G2_9CHLO|nr:putative alpha,alpha-trehalose-phosphate synthase [UDP-forming] 7 [Tetrabaena socialis]|eukprot:PNH09141.1 putative alpha,alpha-trehalose-phosphate synthase [UDP-forming] 7 [Tetrabaena socialis]
MQTARGSYHNLAGLVDSGRGEQAQPSGAATKSRLSLESNDGRATRLLVVSNHLPLRVKRGATGWEFEWDEDALVGQAKEGVPTDLEVLYVGSLPVDVALEEQDAVAGELKRLYNCCPVFLEKDLKDKFYKGCCKQQMWPLFHYVLPMSPESSGRFDQEMWQAYVKANKIFCEKVVEESSTDTDYVWIHDYHLLVLPSLLRKRFNRIRCGLFLHSPFPSSEIFRTFPKREEVLRSLLNADLIGFHTFDYARHFLSCCSRMLGLEHETSRGSITIDYYGQFVGCSPSLSGAIRVNPWSVESTADGIYAAIKLPREHRQLRHEKHWRYVSQHTVAYWATSYIADLQRVTKNHVAMKCYGLGLGLDTFRMVALDANFRRLEERAVASTYARWGGRHTDLLQVGGPPHGPAQVFACTVGQKPSRAPFYLNDPEEVLQLLARLVGVSLPLLPAASS